MPTPISRFCWRLAKSAALAAVLFAGGYSQSGAAAQTVRAWGEGVVLHAGAASQKPTAPLRFKYGKIVQTAIEQPPGTIVVSTERNLLFLLIGDGLAVQYRVATAKAGFEWRGVHKITNKVQWPDWRPPQEMRERRPDLPHFMPGGPDNPLGSRALYLGSSIYRIHGTNEPKSIGTASSSGCIRMHNSHVEELYRLVPKGTKVIVL
jgi:lipoprotein-anchoring transpeptidase ErfK/SrfK